MQTFKSLEEIVSNKEEYDHLYNTDHLFILKGKLLDDNSLINVIGELEYYDWYNKLRGPANGPAKYHNTKNNHEWLHGYVIAVSCNKLTKFEKSAILVGMKHGYTFEKLDLFQTKKELKDNHFDSLFEEA
jgi:hypothetical protein